MAKYFEYSFSLHLTLSHSCFSFASTDKKYMYLNSMSSRNTKTDKILTLWKIYVRFKLTEGVVDLPIHDEKEWIEYFVSLPSLAI